MAQGWKEERKALWGLVRGLVEGPDEHGEEREGEIFALTMETILQTIKAVMIYTGNNTARTIVSKKWIN